MKTKLDYLNEVKEEITFGDMYVWKDEEVFKIMDNYASDQVKEEKKTNQFLCVALLVALIFCMIIAVVYTRQSARERVQNTKIEYYQNILVKENKLINQFYNFDVYLKCHSQKEISKKIYQDKMKRVK
jgi:hypothetical protein